MYCVKYNLPAISFFVSRKRNGTEVKTAGCRGLMRGIIFGVAVVQFVKYHCCCGMLSPRQRLNVLTEKPIIITAVTIIVRDSRVACAKKKKNRKKKKKNAFVSVEKDTVRPVVVIVVDYLPLDKRFSRRGRRILKNMTAARAQFLRYSCTVDTNLCKICKAKKKLNKAVGKYTSRI